MAQQVQHRVNWETCRNAQWCSLNRVGLDHETISKGGVYVIWHGGNPRGIVRVGQASVIRERLTVHRSDQAIQKYANLGLFVTWSPVEASKRDGVERHLANVLNPIVGDKFPNVPPISVNLPW